MVSLFTSFRSISVWSAFLSASLPAFLIIAAPSPAVAVCPDVPGDLDANGLVTVADVQCAILLSLWNLGAVGEPPPCVAVDFSATDVDCSSQTDIGDVVLIVQTVLGTPLSESLDMDQNGCVDSCQCGDGLCAAFECSACPDDCCKPGVVCSSDPCALGPACDNTPACNGKPCPAGNGALCDDGDFCTYGNVCSNGVCGGGQPTDCDDINGCTNDVCDPQSGCIHEPVPGCVCSGQNNPAAADCCYSDTYDGCQYAPCSACVCALDPFCCDAAWDTDCGSVAQKSCFSSCFCGAYDSGNCCAKHTTPGCINSGCVACVCRLNPECCNVAWGAKCIDLVASSKCGSQCPCGITAACSPIYPAGFDLCVMSGSAGEQFDCPVRIVNAHKNIAPATAVQFDLQYDPAKLQLVGFYDLVCFGPGGTSLCYQVKVAGPNSFPLSSGHTVAVNPSDPTKWTGFGGVVVVNVSKPKTPLANAWFDSCNFLTGDSKFVDIRFKLLQDVTESISTYVLVNNILASDGQPKVLNTQWSVTGTYILTKPK